MYSKKYLEDFIVNMINNKIATDQAVLSDPIFILEFKIHAIEEMQLMLYKLNSKMISASRARHSYRLKEEVKILNPKDKPAFLDYAIISGIISRDVILKSTMILGAKFEHQDISNNFNIKHPNTANVQEALNEALIGMQEFELQNSILSKKKPLFKRLSNYLYRRRVAIAFACLGIGCLAAAPFTAGVSVIGGAISIPSLLVTLGIGFAITSSLTAYLAHSGLDKRLEVMNERNAQAQDIREIDSLNDDLSKLKLQLLDQRMRLNLANQPKRSTQPEYSEQFTFTPVYKILARSKQSGNSPELKIRRTNTI